MNMPSIFAAAPHGCPGSIMRLSFKTTGEWQTVKLPFEEFKPYSLKRELKTSKLKTVALVAIKEKFEPDIYLREVAMYTDDNINSPDFRRKLTEEEKRVIIGKGTERPFSGKYNMHF